MLAVDVKKIPYTLITFHNKQKIHMMRIMYFTFGTCGVESVLNDCRFFLRVNSLGCKERKKNLQSLKLQSKKCQECWNWAQCTRWLLPVYFDRKILNSSLSESSSDETCQIRTVETHASVYRRRGEEDGDKETACPRAEAQLSEPDTLWIYNPH